MESNGGGDGALRPQAFAGLWGFRLCGRWLGAGASALAEGFVHHDCARYRDIERAYAARHRDAEEVVAGALDEVVEAAAFAA